MTAAADQRSKENLVSLDKFLCVYLLRKNGHGGVHFKDFFRNSAQVLSECISQHRALSLSHTIGSQIERSPSLVEGTGAFLIAITFFPLFDMP